MWYKIMIRSIVTFAQGGRTVRSVVSYFFHAFEQTQKSPCLTTRAFLKLGPGNVLAHLGVKNAAPQVHDGCLMACGK